MEQIKVWVASLASFIVLDFIYFSAFASKFTQKQLGPLLKLDAEGKMQFNYFAGLLVYALMAFAIVLFVLPKTNGLSPIKSGLWAAALGIIMFGLYELTNFSFIKGWSLPYVFTDIVWGAVAFFLTTLIVKMVFKI